jgi:hypothetical protein
VNNAVSYSTSWPNSPTREKFMTWPENIATAGRVNTSRRRCMAGRPRQWGRFCPEKPTLAFVSQDPNHGSANPIFEIRDHFVTIY